MLHFIRNEEKIKNRFAPKKRIKTFFADNRQTLMLVKKCQGTRKKIEKRGND